jgi:hypothetical protein
MPARSRIRRLVRVVSRWQRQALASTKGRRAVDDEYNQLPIARPIDRQPIHKSRDELGEIWWRGSQWAVTDRGIECLDVYYPVIEPWRLREEFGWIRHIGEKTGYFEIAEFTTAFMVALVYDRGARP